MMNRRAADRHVVKENGMIAIDEHTSVSCLIYDRSEVGVRLTLPDTNAIPDMFLLNCGSQNMRVCKTIWKSTEEIGASFER